MPEHGRTDDVVPEWMIGDPLPAGPVPAEPPGTFRGDMHTIKSDNGGRRDNVGKMARYDLIPPDALEALAIHYGQGARKYTDRNWERGMEWSKSFTSMMRHAWRWFRGESYDAEDPKMPGYRAHHLIAVVWNAFTDYTYEVRGIGSDDRPFSDMLDLSIEAHASAQPEPVNFWYIATPYTRYPAGLQAAHMMACRVTAQLMKAGVNAYSPIAHTHPIAEHGQMDKVDHTLWVRVDAPLLEAAGGMIVVMAESWELSRGVAHEIENYKLAGKPVIYWDPATDIPHEDILKHA